MPEGMGGGHWSLGKHNQGERMCEFHLWAGGVEGEYMMALVGIGPHANFTFHGSLPTWG